MCGDQRTSHILTRVITQGSGELDRDPKKTPNRGRERGSGEAHRRDTHDTTHL